MRALAEFVMRGRAQAIGVAVIGILLPLFPWLGVAAVGLVVLRKGGSDAVVVLGWGLLATFAALLLWKDISPMVALLATIAGAFVLRWTSAWMLGLLAIVAVCFVAALILNVFGGTYVEHKVALSNELQALFQKVSPEAAPETLAQLVRALGGGFNAAQISGGDCARGALSGFAGLALARYWQALLYNPGGFGREFQQLRLSVPVVLMLLLFGFLLQLLGDDYAGWLRMVGLPFVVAGVALMHGMAAQKGWNRGPLVAMYLALFFLQGLAVTVLFLLALVDSWIDFRGRFRSRNP
jgi:hypothetical protein